jgi:hypothetical protein
MLFDALPFSFFLVFDFGFPRRSHGQAGLSTRGTARDRTLPLFTQRPSHSAAAVPFLNPIAGSLPEKHKKTFASRTFTASKKGRSA